MDGFTACPAVPPRPAKPMNPAVAPSHEGLRRSLTAQLNDFICNCHPDRV